MTNQDISRRWFLKDCGVGLGAIAATQLLNNEAEGATADPLAAKQPHFPAKAKNIIYLFMAGAPSHLEMFDYKPQLAKFDGTLPPPELLEGYRAAFINPNSKLLGAWTLYGLGSESRDLPGFVVFSSGTKGPSGGSSNWGSGFLPTVYQGVQLRSVGDPVLYLSNPAGIDDTVQRDSLDAINELNRKRLAVTGDPESATRINSFEMAYRMQASGPELMDLSSEPKHVLDMYGVDPAESSFAKNCLLARRLVQRGVRCVQLFHEAWDQHGNLVKDLTKNCLATDQACAALVKDLKQQGLLDETLVIWGGEFGRTPMVQGGGSDGRDHHPNAFTMWMAGGGMKPGITYGETDDFGFKTTLNEVHVRDLHATILHQLGFDHPRLSVKFQGLDQRLTGVEPARVVKELLS